MREIKFRAWDNVGYMSPPFTLQNLQEKKIQFTSDCPIMQFTGAVDKNGKEIYEWDIDKETGWCIKWNQLHFCWGLFDKNKYFKQELLCSPYKTMTKMYDVWTCDSLEVIGNVYENENLLK
jgi:hypothetical protein